VTVDALYQGKPDAVINGNIPFTGSNPTAALPPDYYFSRFTLAPMKYLRCHRYQRNRDHGSLSISVAKSDQESSAIMFIHRDLANK
jgi:hypothetical protein